LRPHRGRRSHCPSPALGLPALSRRHAHLSSIDFRLGKIGIGASSKSSSLKA
jgi:hypothetical protein